MVRNYVQEKSVLDQAKSHCPRSLVSMWTWNIEDPQMGVKGLIIKHHVLYSCHLVTVIKVCQQFEAGVSTGVYHLATTNSHDKQRILTMQKKE